MKRILPSTALGSLGLALLLPALGGCELDVPVDSYKDNPGILAPLGIVRGTLSYLGPPPCFKNGQVEGAVIVLLFAYDNPPPPDGLASSALNFATVPGEKLFANAPRPTDGPGSTKQPNTSFCPSVSSTFINAATEWSLQQVPAGRYQVRAFYSRENRFNPLFNYANLPLAGDVPGGALENPLAVPIKYAKIEVGVPIKDPGTCKAGDKVCEAQKADAAAGKLGMPDQGFLREGVPISMGGPLKTNRPFFHIDYERSVSFSAPAGITDGGPPVDKDYLTNWDGQRKKLTAEEAKKNGFVTFPQDHLSTSRSKGACLGEKDPACDLFEFAQGSFPTLRFKFGFPGNPGDTAAGADAWVMKNAKPKDVFDKTKARAFYGIDPKEFAADIPTSDGFALVRNFNAAGEPDIIRDNTSLETLAQLADLFPSVVLSKMVEDGEGNVALPPRSQTDPIVVIQTIPLKDWEDGPLKGQGSMKATSQSVEAGGGLTKADGSAVDTTNPLYSRTGIVKQDGLTALIRPSVVCIYPQVDLRGTLVTPVQKDPNPDNRGAALVEREKILKFKGNRVKDIKYGCLPPGHYSVNVVNATGQAWSFPNLSGTCSYSTRFEPNEDCMTTNKDLTGGFMPRFTPGEVFKPLSGINKEQGFPFRPLVKSQMVFQTDDTGKPLVATDPVTGRTFYVPQVVVIKPSPRCGEYKVENDAANACKVDADCKTTPFTGVCIAGPGGKGKFCDYNADGKITAGKVWVNNPDNEDTALDDQKTGAVSEKSANGILDEGEDLNKNSKMDLKVPYTCSLPLAKYASLPTQLQLK